MAKILSATALGTSLVLAQSALIPTTPNSLDFFAPYAQLALAQDSNGSCELTLVHGETRTSFTSFSEALDAAQDGDTLELEADGHITSAIRTDKSLTLDLQGHTLTADMGANGRSGAIAFSGTGTFTLTSSTAGGTLAATVGFPRETGNSAGAYRAVSVTKDGTFVLDAASLQVTYTGASTVSNLPTPAVYGIYADNGSIMLQNGASVTAKASREDNAYGANRVAGLYTAANTKTANVTVSADSSIRAVNNAECVPRSRWQVPDPTSTNSMNSAGDLVQIFPDKSSKFYEEICDKFKKKARFDDAEEASTTSTASTDTEIYYTAPLTLDSGVCVWAYSDPQDKNAKGKLDNIVPTHFFVQSDYVVPTSAYGISSSSSFAGSVDVSGSVSATCTNGDAYALDAQGESTWTTESQAKLEESHGNTENRVEYGPLDLKDYVTPEQKNSIKALGSTSARVVHSEAPTGGAAQVSDKAKVTIAGKEQEASSSKVDLRSDGITVDDAKAAELWKAPDVTIKFSDIHDAGGNKSSITADKKAAFAKTLSDSGISLPQTAESYTEDGTVYRFVGWDVGGDIYSPDYLQNKALVNSEFSGAIRGNVTISAAYVAVGAKQHLVRFVVDDHILAYAADDGSEASYEAAGGQTSANDDKPSKIDAEAGYDYEFDGWQQNGTTLKSLPKVTQDLTFTAAFTKKPKKIDVILRYRNKEGIWNTTNGLSVDYGTDLNKTSRAYAKSGQVIKTSEKVYTFEGWGPRLTDADALYADGELPALAATDAFTRQGNAYYAKYSEQDRALNVTFVVNGKTYAKTSEPVKTTTDFDDVLASCGISNPKNKSKTQRFLGWSTKKNAKTVDIARINAAKLSAVAPKSSDNLTLYAVFGSSSSSTSGKTTRRDISVKLDAKAKKELSVDVSKASITAAGLENAKKLTLSISSTGVADDVVRNNATRNGYQTLVDGNKNKALYEVHLTYTLNGKRHEVYDGFGTIKITAKVPKGARTDKVRAYWLGSTGINYTAAKSGSTRLSIGMKSLGYVDDGVGNLEIALKPQSTAGIAAGSPTPASVATSKMPKAPTPAAVANVKPPKTAKTPKAAKAKKPAAAASATSSQTPGGNANDGTDQNAATPQDANQGGNVVGFAAVLALLAALIARVVWFFVKRHKGDDEEEQADPLPDRETVSF